MKITLSRWLVPILASLVVLGAWLLQASWVYWDMGPPDSDEWHQLTKSWAYWRGWEGHGLQGVLHRLHITQTTFPPLAHLAALPWYAWAKGFSVDAALLSLGPWLALLGMACYGMGRSLADEGAGLTAAIMALSAPLIICLSRKFLLDLPLTAMVACSLWALLRSKGLTRPLPAFVAGLCFALALLAKFIAGVYLLGAFAWLAVPHLVSVFRRWPLRAGLTSAALLSLGAVLFLVEQGTLATWWQTFPEGQQIPVLRWFTIAGVPPQLSISWHLVGLASVGLLAAAFKMEDPTLRALLALLAAAAGATWLAGCWYVPHLPRVIKGVAGFTAEGGAGEGDPTAQSLGGWLYYPWVLANSLPRAWYALVVVGSGATLARRDLRRKAGPLLGSLLLAWLLITLSTNKEARYTLALTPVVVGLAIGWTALLPALPRRLVRGTAATVGLVLSCSWVAVEMGWWAPGAHMVWQDDRIASSAMHTPMDRTLPEDLGPLDLLLPPPFYAVVPLPRTMPFDDNELPFRNFGP